MTVRIRRVHVSGKFSIDADVFGRHLRTLARRHNADVLTTTESKGKKRAVRRHNPEFRVAARGEYLVMWRKGALKSRTRARLRRITVTKWTRLFPSWRDTRLMTKGLKVDRRHKLRISVGHLPAGVQDGATWKRGPVADKASATSRTALRKWGRLLARGRYTQDACGDFNLDQRRNQWREYAEQQLGAPSIWTGRRTPHGTHGSRLIDTAHVRGARITGAHVDVGALPAALDHRAIVYTYEVPAMT